MWSILRYPVVHWLSSLLFATLLTVAWMAVTQDIRTLEDAMGFLVFAGLYGTALSVPTLVLYMAACSWIIRAGQNPWATKAMLDLVAVVGIGVTLFLIGGSLMPALFLVYSFSVVLTSIFIKLPT